MEEYRSKPWNFHTCKLCPYRTKSAFVMYKHVRIHGRKPKTDTFICNVETPEMIECESCEFNTNLTVVLTEHFRLFHDGKEVNESLGNILRCYRCKNCDFETHSVFILTKHTANCAFIGEHKMTRKIDPLLAAENHQQNEFMSVESPKTHGNVGITNWYKETHLAYQANKQCEMHVNGMHTEPKEANQANLCKSAQCSYEHLEQTKRFQCVQCSYKGTTQSSLQCHILRMHPSTEERRWFKGEQSKEKFQERNNPQPVYVNGYKCGKCTFLCIDERILDAHTAEHTKSKEIMNQTLIYVIEYTNQEELRWFNCAYCAFKGKGISSVKEHILTKHTNARTVN